MPISTEELYKYIFEEHRFASELRVKMLASWGVAYAAFAAAFAWVHHEAQPLSWVVTLLAAAFTYAFWEGDKGHRPATKLPKVIGAIIEEDPKTDIPEKRRFFSSLESGTVSHSKVIDSLAKIMLALLVAATGYLLCSQGKLPGSQMSESQSCSSGVMVSQTVVQAEQPPSSSLMTKPASHCQIPAHTPSTPDVPCKPDPR